MRHIQLTHLETLDYYDFPILFLAKEKTQLIRYLCALLETKEDKTIEYIATDIGTDEIEQFKCGHCDLRSIYMQPDRALYLVIVDKDGVNGTRQPLVAFEQELLPDEGYYLEPECSTPRP